jgi:hypothetical protein
MTDHSVDINKMVDPETLEALAQRCEAGEASREMDALVWAAAHSGYIESNGHPGKSQRDIVWHQDNGWKKAWLSGHPWHDRKMLGAVDDAPRYTTSLDAVASLTEAMLPGWTLGSCGSGVAWARPPDVCTQGGQVIHTGHRGDRITEPLARLAAALRALAAEIRGRS